MSELLKLTSMITKEGKMSEVDMIKYLTSSIEDDMSENCIYRNLYKKVYGKVITKELAEDWVKSMSVSDGSERTHGQKWTLDQTTEVGTKISVDWNSISKCEFYATMNMMYSDFYKVAKSFELQDEPTFYARLAKCWLMDDDVGPDKLFNYYFYVVSA